MIALAVILGSSLMTALGLIAWLVVRIVRAAGKEADARVGQVATEAESERTAYELDVTKRALEAANIRARTLEEELTDALDQPSLADGLDAADVAGRVRRLAERWREAAAARNPLPASPEPAVSEQPAATRANPAGLHVVTPIDVLK